MDDSDHDFVDLCPKLLKRARKKQGEPSRQNRTAKLQSYSQANERDLRHRDNYGSKFAATQPVGQDVVCEGTGFDSGDAGSSVESAGATSVKDTRAKEKVLLRMQQFKRSHPQKMAHDNIQPANHITGNPTSEHHRQDAPSSLVSERLNTDEALALRLQQELDREAAEAQSVALEDGGLFFCQICHRDLSHMTPEGRTQHLNRCLDETEQSGPLPPPLSNVPDCPICGKKFKSQKSRSAHLKRCSSEMGISPAVLLQAVQRQAQEKPSTTTANALIQTVGTKRKGVSTSSLPVRKKPKKKTGPLDEETMVALALSSSMLEQQGQKEAGRHVQTGKGRGNRRKATVPRPPPLLLIQDAEAALLRLQERVSSLLLRTRASPPPTPTLSPSTLTCCDGAAPLWLKSAVLDGDFYAAEIKEFFTPTESMEAELLSSFRTSNKSESSVQPVGGGTPAPRTRVSIPPSCSQAASCSSSYSTPGQLPVGSQALRDLMELAEDGMTLTQYGYSKDKHLSGFIQVESEEQADLCASGFLLETTHKPSKDTNKQAVRETDQPGGGQELVALSRLTSDLSSMVNNPQLSDVQLQVDSGQVYFAHSFMVYARCPLLAEMVHESGFGVQEEGMPSAQRVLLSDVPGEAVLALLHYLYTAQCSITASLQPHILELASRFDLKELDRLCHLPRDEAAGLVDETHESNQEENLNNQTDQAFIELLWSMWNEEDEEDNRIDLDGEGDGVGGAEKNHRADKVASSDGELCEERVNEEELEEIYEFAATQKKREERDSEEEDEEEKDVVDEEQRGDSVYTNLKESKRNLSEKHPDPNLQLQPDLSRLFSQSWGTYEEGDSSSSAPGDPVKTRPPQSPHISSSKISAWTSPPNITNLPVIGLSPGPVGDAGRCRHEGEEALKHQRTAKDEPELIVLSDSSDEVEADGAVLSSSRLSPHPRLTQNLQTYTEIKPTPRSATNAATVERSPEESLDCSPELSWLIPSTPVQPGKSMVTSSTQTKSSMCRMKLFPEGDASTPLPAAFSSSVQSKRNASSSVHERSASSGTAESGVSGSKLNRSSSSDATFSPKKNSSLGKDIEMIGGNPSQANRSHSSSLKPHRSLHLPQPDSSTPLHAELRHLPVPGASLLYSGTDKQDLSRQRKERTPPEKTELGSCHLSSLSSPSNPPSSSSHSGCQDSERRSKSCNQSGRPAESSSGDNERKMDSCRDATDDEEEGNDGERSFMAMDEPPIAFNDSWGFDACADVDPGCFSLRLEDSRGSREISPKPAEPAGVTTHSPQSHSPQPSSSLRAKAGPASCSSPPHPNTTTIPEMDNCLLDSKMWDSWEDEGDECLPLSQRIKPSALHKTPVMQNKKRRSLVPITPLPHYSDMDTPELKNKLNRFGVRPLPKRQMILKLKEIHQYTHQLASSDSEGDFEGGAAQTKPPASRTVSCSQREKFKAPRAPAAVSPVKPSREDVQPLSTSQSSNASSTAASEESERSNPELIISSDGDSDSDISSSQAASRLKDRLQAVRAFILSNSKLYNQILQYQPLVLSQLQEQLRAAGIRLAAAKLVDYLDSQCITFTTAKPGQPAPGRRRGKKPSKAAHKASKKKVTAAAV